MTRPSPDLKEREDGKDHGPAALTPAASGAALPDPRQLLLARASRAFAGFDVAAALPAPRRAIVFLKRAPGEAEKAGMGDEVVRRAQKAVDILRHGQPDEVPAPELLEALELCIRLVRPALLVQDDHLPQDRSLHLSAAQRSAIEGWLPGVAALCRSGEETGLGTGFLIGPTTLLTNRHVVQALARSQALEPALTAGQVEACFDLEAGRAATRPRIAITRVLTYHPDKHVDVALLELASAGPPVLPLRKAPALVKGRAVLAVGHPVDDGRNPSDYVRALFDDIFSMKRASPGEITGAEGPLWFHDCSTLGGNSGSPLFDCGDGAESAVIGVHSGGIFAYRNEAVSAAVLLDSPALSQLVSTWS